MPDFTDIAALLSGAFGGYAQAKERRFNQDRLQEESRQNALMRQTQADDAARRRQEEADAAKRATDQAMYDKEYDTWAMSEPGQQTLQRASTDPAARAEVVGRASRLSQGRGAVVIQSLGPDLPNFRGREGAKAEFRAPAKPHYFKIATRPGERQRIGYVTEDGQKGEIEFTSTTPGPTMNAQQLAAQGRFEAGVADMNNAAAFMKDFEERYRRGEVSFNGIEQFAGDLANAFTETDAKAIARRDAALVALNEVNPELARYLRRGYNFAEGESLLSARPSDFRTKMAHYLSTMPTGASSGMIDDIISRREAIVDPLNRLIDFSHQQMGLGGGGGGGGGGGATAGGSTPHGATSGAPHVETTEERRKRLLGRP